MKKALIMLNAAPIAIVCSVSGRVESGLGKGSSGISCWIQPKYEDWERAVKSNSIAATGLYSSGSKGNNNQEPADDSYCCGEGSTISRETAPNVKLGAELVVGCGRNCWDRFFPVEVQHAASWLHRHDDKCSAHTRKG